MANSKHIKALKKGSEYFNKWRIDCIKDFENGGDWEKVDLSGEDFCGIDFRFFDFVGVNFKGSKFVNSRFSNCDLSLANFESANFKECGFHSCTISEANFQNSMMENSMLGESKFTRSNVKGVSFKGTQFFDIIFDKMNFLEVSFLNTELLSTVFVDSNLNKATNLETCFFGSKLTFDHSTLIKSDRIPINFLRKGGVPENYLEILPLLRKDLSQYHSCFISFTEYDDALSETIYNDLQQKGVRCWRWKEDAKWGEKLIYEIDKAVKLHDKLIVIVSKESLNSEPVIREIERALQRESKLVRRGERKSVLFPIRVDDFIFDWDHPLQADLVERNIGDFKSWKDHNSYEKAFKKLVEDLKAE